MDYTKQSPVILSLCPGMRGLERGFERSCERLNWKLPSTAAYVEIESFVNYNLVKQMEQGLLAPAPIWSNIKTAPWEVFRGKIDFIFGGYPCQPFSLAGQQKGVEDPRHLWPYIAKGIDTIRPVGCFFENVRNHLNIGYETVRAELQEMGYEVREGIYSAEEVGAPHRRDRLFILAIRKDVVNTGLFRQAFSEIKTAGVEQSGEGELANSEKQLCELSRDSRDRWTGFTDGSNAMAHPNSSGQQQYRGSITDEQKQPTFERNSESWPSRPGVSQHDWERPRVEPRMGFMLNGYNFREDLLRMAGNGVVEQTAEVAFIDLLRKHYE